MKRFLLVGAAGLALLAPASAQTHYDTGSSIVAAFDPLAFAPANLWATLSASTAAAPGVAVPTTPTAPVLVVYNNGANAAYVALGATSTAAETAAVVSAVDVVQPGGCLAFRPGSKGYLAAITASSTTGLILSAGEGFPLGCGGGGGSGGGGGGGAVTQSGTWTVQPGNTANTTAWLFDIPIGGTLDTDIKAPLATQAPTVSIGGVGIVDSGGTNVATVKAASTLPAAVDKTLVVGLNPGTATAGTPTGAIVTVQGVSGGQVVPVAQSSQYPIGSTPVTNSPASGTTGAVTATLPATLSQYTFICGFSLRANATAALTGNIQVTGTISGSLNYIEWVAPAASGIGVTEEIFTPCIPSSAVNTAIAITSLAASTGGNTSLTAWGYTKATTP